MLFWIVLVVLYLLCGGVFVFNLSIRYGLPRNYDEWVTFVAAWLAWWFVILVITSKVKPKVVFKADPCKPCTKAGADCEDCEETD